MPCKRDVERAILDSVFKEVSDIRPTFTRLSDDTMQINGTKDNKSTKATKRSVSLAIAYSMERRVNRVFGTNAITVVVHNRSIYDPVEVNFRVNPAYTEHEYNKLPLDQRNDPRDGKISFSPDLNSEEERGFVNANTGANTDEHQEQQVPLVSTYSNYIAFKKSQIKDYNDRAKNLEIQAKQPGLTAKQIEALERSERAYKLAVYGNKDLGIIGLYDEITELEDKANTKSVAYYIEKNLDRLQNLASSNSSQDIVEARSIVKLLSEAGTFVKGEDNPFFSQDLMFQTGPDGKLTGEYKLDQYTRDTFSRWKDIALGLNNIVESRAMELAENTVNSSVLVKATFKEDKSFDELFNPEEGLKDADPFSMWLLDPTHGLASENGLAPQVIVSRLIQATEAREKYSRDLDEFLAENDKDIKDGLLSIGENVGKFGITGIQAPSFNIFKRISKEGNQDNSLVQRQSKEFDDAKSRALYVFSSKFNKAKTFVNSGQRNTAINKIFEELKRWRRENTITVDPNRLGEASYRDELVKAVGEKAADEAIAEQQSMIDDYYKYRKGSIERLLIEENKDTYDELSNEAKNKIQLWEHNNSPFKGFEDANSVNGLFFGDMKVGNYMRYNSMLPRKFKADIVANTKTDKYEVTDTAEKTGHWDENYEKIHSNPALSTFYDKVKEFCEVIHANLDYDLQEKVSIYTLPGLMKTTAEIINANSEVHSGLSKISLAYRNMIDNIRTSFGVVKQSNVAYTTTDGTTGKDNYKVNDSFIRANYRSIAERVLIESTRFMQSFNATLKKGLLANIKKSTTLYLHQLNPSSLLQLAEYLHVSITVDDANRGNIDAIRSKLSKTEDGSSYIVPIGRLINEFSQHSVVQSYSFDLPRLMRHFSELTMAYAARKDALPVNSILKEFYQKIKAPETNNVKENVWNKLTGKYNKAGLRTNANRQFDDWFDRVHLGNYGEKHEGVFGSQKKVLSAEQEAIIDGKISALRSQLVGLDTKSNEYSNVKDKIDRLYSDKIIPKFGQTIYSRQERLELGKLQGLIENEKSPERRSELEAARDRLGKTRTGTALMDNFLNWIRGLRLGYNLSSMVTNFLEGVTSNLILGASDEYFDPKELYYGYGVIKHSFLKNATFGYIETGLAKKTRSLADRFNMIVDNRNMLQKNYSDKVLDAANPYSGNQRVEYINQTPLMIAVLRTIKLKDINGAESSVWDALDNSGHLKTEFQTDENKDSWENLEGDQYVQFKNKVNELIQLGHGNYNKMRGMMAKSYSAGKLLMMFKTWLPEMLYWRFAKEQSNIFLGKESFKGRYRSYGVGSGMIHGAATGAIMFGPIGALIGLGVGGAAAAMGGMKSSVGVLQESVEATRLLIKKLIGMPVNLLAGRQLININEKQIFGKGKYFDYVGKNNPNFTEQDSKNLQANMADLGIQLIWLALALAVKHFFWDDDDKQDSAERQFHNIMINKLMQLGSQASMYTNPVALKDNLIQVAALQYLTDVGKTADRLQKWANGEDIIQSGVNAGKSGLGIQAKKILLPGIFKDDMLGFSSVAKSVYPKESPYHVYFHGAEYKEKAAAKADRAEVRKRISNSEEFKNTDGLGDEELKARKKAIEKEVNIEVPNKAALKKLGVTRQEYEKDRGQ